MAFISSIVDVALPTSFHQLSLKINNMDSGLVAMPNTKAFLWAHLGLNSNGKRKPNNSNGLARRQKGGSLRHKAACCLWQYESVSNIYITIKHLKLDKQ